MRAGPVIPPKRSYVKIDKFALFDIGRKFGLSAVDRFALVTLTLRADHRTQRLITSLTELAEDCGVSRRTASGAVARLKAAGLIEELQPFGSGRTGEVGIVAYSDLVVPEARPARGSAWGYRQPRPRGESADAVPDLEASAANHRANPAPASRSGSADWRAAPRSLRAAPRDDNAPTRENALQRGREIRGRGV